MPEGSGDQDGDELVTLRSYGVLAARAVKRSCPVPDVDGVASTEADVLPAGWSVVF